MLSIAEIDIERCVSSASVFPNLKGPSGHGIQSRLNGELRMDFVIQKTNLPPFKKCEKCVAAFLHLFTVL